MLRAAFAVAALVAISWSIAVSAGEQRREAPTSQPTSRPASALERARMRAASAQIESLKTALEVFEIDTGRYPTTEEGLAALVKAPAGVNGWRGPYLREVPKDPWGRPYIYRCPGQRSPNSVDLLSYGPDGKEGGGDDITNWSGR